MLPGLIPSLSHHTDSGERLPGSTPPNYGVVGADGLGLTVLCKGTLRNVHGIRSIGRIKSVARQQIPGCRVLDSQRVDPSPLRYRTAP